MTETDPTQPLDDVTGVAEPRLSAEDAERIRAMQVASEMRAVRLATGATDDPDEAPPAEGQGA